MATSDDCGCNNSSGCTETETNEYFIAKVEKAKANTCSAEAECPFNTPFYDKTLTNTSFVIGSVGGFFTISVCDNNRWAVGQWVYIPDAGRFQITDKEGCSILYLRNGCGTGETATAIVGNATPGKMFQGEHKIWLSQDPGCNDEPTGDYCTDLLNSIADCSTPICKVFDPVADDEDYRLIAATHLGEDSTLKSCLVKAFGIIVKKFTLCFTALPQNSLTKVGDDPVQDVQAVPDNDGNFCLAKRALPANPSIDIYCGGVKQYLKVPTDWKTKKYVLGVDPDGTSGCPAFIEPDFGCDIAQTRHPINTNRILNISSKTINSANRDQVVNFASILPTLPDCADDEIAVEINARLTVTSTVSNQYPTLSCKVTQDSVDVVVAIAHSHPSFNSDTNSIILKLDKNDPEITFVCSREGSSTGGTFSLLIDVLAFHY